MYCASATLTFLLAPFDHPIKNPGGATVYDIYIYIYIYIYICDIYTIGPLQCSRHGYGLASGYKEWEKI